MGDSTPSDEIPDDPFRGYHRGGLRAAVLRGAVLAVLAAAVAAPLGWAVASGGGQNPALATELALAEAQRVVVQDERLAAQWQRAQEQDAAAAGLPPEPAAVLVRQSVPAPPVEPAAVAPAPAVAVGPAAPPPPRPDLTIAVDTVGYQEEIDQCLWVRMDFGSSPAPIVAAHNYCGGDVVLELRRGDLVRLRGVGLDGLYRVTAAREVATGEKVGIATEGIVADAILQTCFWHTGTTRLVSVVRAD